MLLFVSSFTVYTFSFMYDMQSVVKLTKGSLKECCSMDWRYENLDIPFLDLKLQYDHIKDEVKQAIEEILQSCEFILGPRGSAF